MTVRALTIAGADPTGGAGVQQDLFTFASAGVWGLSALAALTVQDAEGVSAVIPTEAGVLEAQIAVAGRVGASAAKTGLLPTVEAVEAVARSWDGPLVVDPVLVASSGDALTAPGVAAAITSALLPRARLVTPNAAEASALTGIEVTDAASQLEAARVLATLGTAALVTGGHLPGREVLDLLVDGGDVTEFRRERLEGGAGVRGTGCRLSAGVAARLAQGAALPEAVADAIGWVRAGIERSYEVGGMRVLGGFA